MEYFLFTKYTKTTFAISFNLNQSNEDKRFTRHTMFNLLAAGIQWSYTFRLRRYIVLENFDKFIPSGCFLNIKFTYLGCFKPISLVLDMKCFIVNVNK